MAFDPGTYTPGDPWVTQDFIYRAFAPPQIKLTLTAPGQTTGSYFEHRADPANQGERTFKVVVAPVAGGAFSVDLEISLDKGVTWLKQKTYTATTIEDVPVHGLEMYRLKATTAPASGLNLSLLQYH